MTTSRSARRAKEPTVQELRTTYRELARAAKASGKGNKAEIEKARQAWLKAKSEVLPGAAPDEKEG